MWFIFNSFSGYPWQVNSKISGAKNSSILNLDVSERQAFGGSYCRPKDLDEALRNYWANRLILPPQPVWEGNFTDWSADPFQDRNWRFQHQTLRWINPLRWAALDGDQDARTEWIRVAKSWATENIPAQASPSDFGWKDMVDGNRAIQLTLGAPLVGEDDAWFAEALEYHRDWLMDESHIVGKNHGLHQHTGLLVVGAILRDSQAVETAVSRMSKQFESTFDIQGANDEGSSSYHQMNIIWWSHAWKRAQLEGVEPPAETKARLNAAMNVLAHIAMPNGEIPQIGDAARGRVNRGLSEVTDFVATRGVKGTAPNNTTLVLDRGYIISRSGWGEKKPLADESHMLARYGDDLRSHSHQDRGSVHIYSGAQRWLVDSGFHSYQSGIPEVKYLKSREAHNVASLPKMQHDDSAPVELILQNVNDDYHEFILADQGYENTKLQRRIIYFTGPDCWIVIDTTDSDSPLQHVWHLEPSVTSQMNDYGYRLTAGKKSFNVQWIGRNVKFTRTKADEESFRGWIGTAWKTMTPSERLVATSTNGRKQIVTLLSPNHPHPLAVIDSRVSGAGDTRLRLARGLESWRIDIGENATSIAPI